MKIEQPYKYRADIDGLRAIAVISVILFHLDKKILPGGFVGVDIFFAISGYLITKIIYNEIVLGSFSFLEFYKRRIKRIAPAFFICTIVTFAIGLCILEKPLMKPLARSVISSIFSFANIYFYKTLNTSYFDNNLDITPLLHMWSLGVEEQFYFFWPLSLLLVSKFLPKRILLFVFIASIASFTYAEIMLYVNAKFAYYMIFTRSGEMFLGGAAALYLNNPSHKHLQKHTYEIISILGLGLIIYSIIYTNSMHFPGIAALLPCLGTVMIIYSGSFYKQCIVNKLLSIRPLVFIGLISYSLYLWHWPLIVYANYFYYDEIPHRIIIMILTLLLGCGSYYFIESPIRRSYISTYKTYILLYFLPALLISAICISIFSPKVRDYIAPDPEGVDKAWHTRIDTPLIAPLDRYSNYCFSEKKPTIDLIKAPSCINGYNKSKEPNVLFFGDSHAMHFVNFWNILGKHYHFSFRTLSRSACPPVLTDNADYGGEPKVKQECLEFRNMIKDYITQYNYVILSGFWSNDNYKSNIFKDLEQTVKFLSSLGIKTIVLGHVPLFLDYKSKCRVFRTPSLGNCREVAKTYSIQNLLPLNNDIKKLTKKYKNVYYMDVIDIICPNGQCSIYINDALVYLDENHLSLPGSTIIGKEFINKGIPLPEVFKEIIDSQK